MTTVHKYPLAAGATNVETFEGVRFLTAHNQGEQVTVWAEVDPAARPCTRMVYVIPTGREVPAAADYLGTVLIAGGMFVFHVYVEVGSR